MISRGTRIALLRAVNVAGHQSVAMADLRDLLSELGFRDPRSLLQSGNLVFDAGRQSDATIERMLEQNMKARLGLDTNVFVRSADDWTSIIARNPFRDEAVRGPARLVVLLLKTKPNASAFTALQASVTGPEIVHGDGRQAYLVYPDGIGRSRLTAAVIEKKLATRGTARNWNTVTKLAALAKI